MFYDISVAGISSAKLVEAHGTFASSTCTRCDQKYDGEETKVNKHSIPSLDLFVY